MQPLIISAAIRALFYNIRSSDPRRSEALPIREDISRPQNHKYLFLYGRTLCNLHKGQSDLIQPQTDNGLTSFDHLACQLNKLPRFPIYVQSFFHADIRKLVNWSVSFPGRWSLGAQGVDWGLVLLIVVACVIMSDLYFSAPCMFFWILDSHGLCSLFKSLCYYINTQVPRLVSLN